MFETFCKYTNEVKVRYDFKNAEFLKDTNEVNGTK